MNILEEAIKITSEDRRADYGDARTAVQNTCDIWSVILDKTIEPWQFCLMMVALKMTRQIASRKRDNLVDIAGYARVGEMIDENPVSLEGG